jgi:pilus assembly protein Flp/PilA
MLFLLRQMFQFTSSFIRTRMRSERGATAVEYGLLVALIAVVIVGAVFALGGNINDMFGKANDGITKKATSPAP